MAMTDAERKRRQRERQKGRGLQTSPFTMDLTRVERENINEAADARGFEDRTEYLLNLVYIDRDKSRKENVCSYPKCKCPFDKGPDNKCLRGMPNPEDL
ncbi:hypothetical protein ACJO2E_02650 [Marinobacter sp. M1N3S26]|uniref:hypothetical protein n=1 Tax=Marinobacter sp. M1N3S26 TaxID=3382299 RepID=UPI00387B1325